MANKKYEETDIQAIADAIREKTGSEDTYKVSEMASGVNEVYEEGVKSEYNDFWDTYQQNGTRTLYIQAFSGHGWIKGKTFKPKYDITPVIATRMFAEHTNQYSSAYDLVEYLNELGIILDLSKLGTEDVVQYMFMNARFNHLPELDLRNPQTLVNIIRSGYVKKIDKIIINNSGAQAFTNAFLNCRELTDVIFEGVIGRSISFVVSPLTAESMKSVITHLKDYSGTTSEFAYTVTFLTSAFEVLEAEGATAEYNGVACTWAELIDNLKWNLVKA